MSKVSRGKQADWQFGWLLLITIDIANQLSIENNHLWHEEYSALTMEIEKESIDVTTVHSFDDTDRDSALNQPISSDRWSSSNLSSHYQRHLARLCYRCWHSLAIHCSSKGENREW
jgi:hypothetical protein